MKDVVLSVAAMLAVVGGMAVTGVVYNLIVNIVRKKRMLKKLQNERLIQQRINTAVNEVKKDYERKAFFRECAFEAEKRAAVRDAELRVFRMCDKALGLGSNERNRLRENGLYL